MFLTQKQNESLEIPFGYVSRRASRFLAAQFHVCTYLSIASVDQVGKRDVSNELSLRQVLDLALDEELLMSELGAARFRDSLNFRLPPIWPGDLPLQLELVGTGSPDCFAVTVPPPFHNRLHRFPFQDGFLVCPVPDCTGTPKLQGTLHRSEGAQGGLSCIVEHTCGAGHHWQTIFFDDDQVTAISVVRLRRKVSPRNEN